MRARRPVVILLAVALDLLAGEPPSAWHPVAWIGRALALLEARLPRRTLADGAAALATVTLAVVGAATVMGATARHWGGLGVLLEALALKPAFAARRLAMSAGEVEAALAAGSLEEARRLVGRHLVSRDTASLDQAHVASAAIESIAENLGDSIVAPLLAYATGGLGGAWAYRVVNTADAMWGYHDPRHEWFGKPAARLDDIANLVPSRLAAVTLAVGAVLAGANGPRAWATARRDHGRTASPNAGWPMAAMAGALGVGLEKPGHYRLGDAPLPAAPRTIGRAVRVFAFASGILVATAVAWAVLREGRR